MEMDVVDDFLDGKRALAPSRDEINEMVEPDAIYELLSVAEDKEISIKTQLEYLNDGDEDLKHRRVQALIYWKIAIKNMKKRLMILKSLLKGETA